MSENINIANEVNVDHELIPCVESLELIHNDTTTDHDYVEGISPENCLNGSMHFSEPIDSSEQIDSTVLPENNINNKEIQIVNFEELTDEKLMNISGNSLDLIDMGAIDIMNNKPSSYNSDGQNEIVEINNFVDINIDAANQRAEGDKTGKFKNIYMYLIHSF